MSAAVSLQLLRMADLVVVAHKATGRVSRVEGSGVVAQRKAAGSYSLTSGGERAGLGSRSDYFDAVLACWEVENGSSCFSGACYSATGRR